MSRRTVIWASGAVLALSLIAMAVDAMLVGSDVGWTYYTPNSSHHARLRPVRSGGWIIIPLWVLAVAATVTLLVAWFAGRPRHSAQEHDA